MKTGLLVSTLALSAAAFGAGCAAHAQASGYAEADAPVVFVGEPTLVLVEPGIWVVRDYDYAVYYVDDYYWVYRGDAWYRSRAYDSGWVTVTLSAVPPLVVHRDHNVYVHYHGTASAQTRKAPHEQVAGAQADHDRPEHADNRREHPPGLDKDKDKDKDRGPPEHANDHRGDPPGQDKDKDRGPPEHANDHRDAPPGHDGRADANPRDDKQKKDEHKADDDKKQGDKQRENGKK